MIVTWVLAVQVQEVVMSYAVLNSTTMVHYYCYCCVYKQVFHAAKDKLFRREGYFDLLGFDFMLDDKLELYLLEVNTNPALSLDSSPVLQEVCTLILLYIAM
jgi:Tubulin-tyrosine ligase family